MGVACPVLAWVLAPGGTGKPQPTSSALLSESVKALAAQLQQLVALGVAQLYCCAEAFGYAAH